MIVHLPCQIWGHITAGAVVLIYILRSTFYRISADFLMNIYFFTFAQAQFCSFVIYWVVMAAKLGLAILC